jgi:hypothetical protein
LDAFLEGILSVDHCLCLKSDYSGCFADEPIVNVKEQLRDVRENGSTSPTAEASTTAKTSAPADTTSTKTACPADTTSTKTACPAAESSASTSSVTEAAAEAAWIPGDRRATSPVFEMDDIGRAWCAHGAKPPNSGI